MKKINVSILDKQTLRLEEDARKGDIIDLNELLSVDLDPINKLIKEEKDKVYLNLLNEEREKLNNEFKLKLNEELAKQRDEIVKLNATLEKVKEDNKTEIERVKQSTLKDIEYKYQREVDNLKNELDKVSKEKDLHYQSLINKKEQDLINLNNTLKTITLENENKFNQKISEKELNHLKEKQVLEEEIANLKRARSALSVKNIGEDLETWCDNEYHTQAIAGLSNVTWEKDNEVINRTKADFIYKVYATSEKREEELLTSVILEMKSEDPESTNQQDINRMLEKLNKDRNNKDIEYAFLVSELGQTSNNSLPIKRVLEYEKMYMVRPEYFILLLNIVTAFGLSYKDLLLAKEEERLKFKDFEDILTEFEEMKLEILDHSLKHINTHLEEIIKQSNNIKSANKKLLDSAELIKERHLKTVVNKLNDFKINQIAEKVKQL